MLILINLSGIPHNNHIGLDGVWLNHKWTWGNRNANY